MHVAQQKEGKNKDQSSKETKYCIYVGLFYFINNKLYNMY